MSKNPNITKSGSNADNKLLVVVAIIVAALIGLLIYRGTTSDGTSTTGTLKEKLGEVILLEDGEEARILTIDNADDAKQNNVFYKNAENGDTLFVFQNRVMIYRESNNQLINVAPYLGGENFDPTAESEVNDVTDIINTGSNGSDSSEESSEEASN